MGRKRKGYILLFCVSVIFIMITSVPAMAAESRKLDLTPEEIGYLEEKKVLKVAVTDGWQPYVYENNTTDAYSGFAIDILDVLREEGKVSIEYVEAKNYEEAFLLLEDGRADVVAFTGKEGLVNETEEGFVPYITAPVQIITGNDMDIPEKQDLKAAVPTGIRHLKLEKYDNIKWLEYTTTEDCIKAVEKKQADFATGDLYTLKSFEGYFTFKDMTIKNIPDSYITVGFLTAASENTLQGILAKVRGSLSAKEISDSLNFHGDRLRDEHKIVSFIYFHVFDIINIFLIIVFLTIIIVILIYMKIRLDRPSEMHAYEQSYRMLADTFGQAGMEYDFQNDRLTIFGERRDEIDIPEVVDNLREKLKKRALRITLTGEEFDKFCTNSEPGKTYQTEFQCGMKGNGWNWFSMIYIVVGSEESHRRPHRLIGVLVDAQKQHQTQEKLVEIGQYDNLTQVFNRAGAETLIMQALQNLEEYSQNVFLLMDVDLFKQINDNYGHMCGDDVLRTIGHNIREIFQGDTIICRWGGDEFTMFVRGPGAAEELLEKRIEELRRRMKEYRYEDMPCPIGLSISGVIPKAGMTLQSLFIKADNALYQIKEEGRDKIGRAHV